MPEPSLDEKLDALYAADPDDFVACRKRMQGELRTAGLKAEAALLARARRPSTSMWAVNQMVRRRPELVDALLRQSEALRNAQARGDRDALREAIRAHRAAVAAASDATLDALGSRANDSFREEILTVLRAASTQPELGEQLRAGRLVRPDDITPQFPELDDGVVRPAEPRQPVDQEGDAERAARAAERETRQQLDDARREGTAANESVDAAQHRVDELTEELTHAREELRDARSRARKATAASERLGRRLESATES
jgi:hypothetical protein